MKLTLWLTLGFVARAGIFAFFTYRTLDVQLRHGNFERELMVNRVRANPTRMDLTLGLGLQAVRALVNQQPSLRLRQHHGIRFRGTRLTFPVATGEDRLKASASAGRERRHISVDSLRLETSNPCLTLL